MLLLPVSAPEGYRYVEPNVPVGDASVYSMPGQVQIADRLALLARSR